MELSDLVGTVKDGFEASTKATRKTANPSQVVLAGARQSKRLVYPFTGMETGLASLNDK
jgi:hypothetical protein